MNGDTRRLPLGIQSFSGLRKDDYIYVDKTDLVYKLANGSMYNYLSRPRRFGKSLLVDTLKCYFEGKKELFEGLKIASLEEAWTEYPVIKLDMSSAGQTESDLRDYFKDKFSIYEKKFGLQTDNDVALPVRFKNIINRASEQYGLGSVILIDEYDAPLQHTWKAPEHEGCRNLYRSVFAILKSESENIRFVFITGIAKFTQISLFSVLNNLNIISYQPQYEAICGITESELREDFKPEIERMSQKNGWSVDETLQKLKDLYDGYHFSREMTADIYNPYSLINALEQSYLSIYWAASGATNMLPMFVENIETKLNSLNSCLIDKGILESSDLVSGFDELFLYQCGYLTIKGVEEDSYRLGFPNEEVRSTLYKFVIPSLVMRQYSDIYSIQMQLKKQLVAGELVGAIKSLKSLIADVPYSNKKLECMDMEERYRLIISNLLHSIGLRTEVEHQMFDGRIDILTWTTQYIYVIELKLEKNGGINAAEKQMLELDYKAPFSADSRQVIGLAIELDDMGKGLIDWKQV